MSSDSSTYLLEILFNIKLKVWHFTFCCYCGYFSQLLKTDFSSYTPGWIPTCEPLGLKFRVLELQAFITQKHFYMIFLNLICWRWCFFMEKRDLPQSPPILYFDPLYNFIYRLESNVSFECRHYEQFNTQVGSSCHSHKTFILRLRLSNFTVTNQ